MDGILDKKQVLVQLGSLRIHLQSNPEKSRESSLALTKIDEAIMWLEKDAGKQLDELEAVRIIPCENTISKTHIERMEDDTYRQLPRLSCGPVRCNPLSYNYAEGSGG